MFSLPIRGMGSAVLLVILLATASVRAASPDADGGALLSPDAAVVAALDLHPNLRSAEAQLARAQGAAAEAALLLSNPSVSASTTPDGARMSAGASLPLSVTGAGWHERTRSRAQVDAASASVTRKRLEVAAQTRSTYTRASVAVGRVRVALEGQDLAARLGRAVIRLNEEGEASTLEVRLARLAEVQAAAGLLEAREAEALALQELASVVGRPVASGHLVEDPLAAAPSSTGSVPAERSDVVAAWERLRTAEADLRLQRALALPPVELGVFAEIEDGRTFVGPTVGLELPLFRRNQGGRAGASAQVGVAEAAVTAISARAQTEVVTAEQRVAEALTLSEALIADPVAEARAALASIEAGYLAGEIDLPSTVLLQARVLDGEAAAIELFGRIATARIDLLLATEDPALIGGTP